MGVVKHDKDMLTLVNSMQSQLQIKKRTISAS